MLYPSLVWLTLFLSSSNNNNCSLTLHYLQQRNSSDTWKKKTELRPIKLSHSQCLFDHMHVVNFVIACLFFISFILFYYVVQIIFIYSVLCVSVCGVHFSVYLNRSKSMYILLLLLDTKNISALLLSSS